MTVKQDRKITL